MAPGIYSSDTPPASAGALVPPRKRNPSMSEVHSTGASAPSARPPASSGAAGSAVVNGFPIAMEASSLAAV